jgi:serine/threonine protein kinase/tetratricopeptide (TPR) repeat protein
VVDLAGQSLGRYGILDKLGEGGMGEVWLARDERLGRKVALKTLPPELAAQPERRRRFEVEARAVAALNHPNIVTLYSVEEEDGLLLLTMEYVEGRTLASLIPANGLSVEDFFDHGLPITEAIDAAHAHGIAHRDIKPANIMVTGDGRIKVLDFGLARIVGDDLESTSDPGEAETRTAIGQVIGTLPYMAPEQVGGGNVDHRSDLFSLGIVFFEMLAGSRPFTGSSPAALASAILRDPPPDLDSIRSDLPSGLAQAVSRCLEKEPAERHPSAADLGRDLANARQAMIGGRMAAPSKSVVVRGASSTTIAVVDFENIARDSETDWLSSGIAETLAVDLKKAAGLAVVSRDRVVKTWETMIEDTGDRDHLNLARRLGASAIVAGGFQKHGEAIRVTVQVVDAATGEVSESFHKDGTTRAIFELQDEVVTELRTLLEGPITQIEKPAAVRPATGQLEAFECVARGRWHVRRLNVVDFQKAREFFARAIEIDPRYAEAHVGLGETHAMAFIANTNPDDLEAAVTHLRRAVELDPDNHSPYALLCYSLMRYGRLEEAIEAGRRAARLDPENSLGHYFLAVALWVQAGREFRGNPWPEIFRELAESTRLTPRYQAANQLLGAVLMFRGRYGDARQALVRASEIEASQDYELARFAGSHAALARLNLREGLLDDALDLGHRSLEILRDRENVYTAATTALTHGVIGDVLLRQHRPGDAVAEYRQAVEVAQSNPQSLGIGAILVRSRLGLARCLYRSQMAREAMTLYEEATDLFRLRQGYDFSWIWEATDADLYMEMALYHATAGHEEEAVVALEKAIGCGWGDPHLLENEPAFAALREKDTYREIARRVEFEG